jgi:hypothetical protein
MAVHCLRAVKSQMLECVHKYEKPELQKVLFFFTLKTIKTKEVKLNFLVKIDKVIFHESSIIIELEYYRVIKIIFLRRRWLCTLFRCATLYGP